MATKVILVNGGALDQKYGDSSGEVWKAIDALIAADAKRGVKTELVKLDDSSGRAGSAAISHGAAWTEVRTAVNMVDGSYSWPRDYVLLLGGPDLLPHCELDNPTPDDGDPTVPSDLPYACTNRGGGAISDYLGPTRVVSRLPDVPGATEPSVLLALLGYAAGFTTLPPRFYDGPLAISAEVWKGSSALTLAQLLGFTQALQLSPPKGPNWGESLPRLHFANLHGAPRSTQYFGQREASFPVAHDAALVEDQVKEGAIAAVEACYGAELFDPEGQLPMPLTYLRSGAYAFFGSTTIAYGPATGNDYADIVCRLFLGTLLEGASIGRAGLETRQKYIAQAVPLDPIDLKTVAQFLVLGDPSLQPVTFIAREPIEIVGGIFQKHEPGEPKPEDRRQLLRESGEALRRVPRWTEPIEGALSDETLAALHQLTPLRPELDTSARTLRLVAAPGFDGEVEIKDEEGAKDATMHLLMQEVELEEAPMTQRVVVVAVEAAGQLLSLKTAMTR